MYSCCFSKHNDSYIVAGTSGGFEIRLFDRSNNNKCVDVFGGDRDKGVFSLDWAYNR